MSNEVGHNYVTRHTFRRPVWFATTAAFAIAQLLTAMSGRVCVTLAGMGMGIIMWFNISRRCCMSYVKLILFAITTRAFAVSPNFFYSYVDCSHCATGYTFKVTEGDSDKSFIFNDHVGFSSTAAGINKKAKVEGFGSLAILEAMGLFNPRYAVIDFSSSPKLVADREVLEAVGTNDFRRWAIIVAPLSRRSTAYRVGYFDLGRDQKFHELTDRIDNILGISQSSSGSDDDANEARDLCWMPDGNGFIFFYYSWVDKNVYLIRVKLDGNSDDIQMAKKTAPGLYLGRISNVVWNSENSFSFDMGPGRKNNHHSLDLP
jgi:hypothetical protein